MKAWHTAFIAVFAGSLLAGCAASTVSINSNYDISRIKRIAVLNFEPAAESPQSGATLAGVFERFLLEERYQVVDRAKVEKILKEQHFQLSGAVDPSQAVEIGKILGVDALLFGNVTTFRQSEKSVYLVDTVSTRQEPIVLKQKRTVVKDGKEVAQEFEEISGYKTVRDVTQVPQVYTLQAEVAAVAKMVDTLTGEIIWVGNDRVEGADLQTAAEIVAKTIVRDWKKTVRKAEAKKVS
jgi:hypothetical protein